jgi:molybdenum cofactor cytidylyltransferase
MRTLAVLLAAGSGSRWSTAGGRGHKLTAVMADAQTVFQASLGAAREAAASARIPILIITGAVDLTPWIASSVLTVHNSDWADGQATSLRCATRYAERHGFDSVVVGLGDQPWISPAMWLAVVERLQTPGLPIVIPTIDGVRGQPVGLRSSHWAELPVTGDEGARSLARKDPCLVEELVCVGDTRSLTDIDTPGDLSP